MNLRKKLAIALLCTSMVYPLCMAMDESQKTMAAIEHQRNTELALCKLPDLAVASVAQNAYTYLEETRKHLALEAENGHTPAINLLEFLESLREGKEEDTIPFLRQFYYLGKFYYVKEEFDYGFMYLLPLLQKNFAEGNFTIKNFLSETFKQIPAAASHFDGKLDQMLEGRLDSMFGQGEPLNIVRLANKEKIQNTFLDILCEIDHITGHLDSLTLGRIGSRYWRAFYSLTCEMKYFPQANTNKEIQRNNYLKQAMLYSILSAKAGCDTGYWTLDTMLNAESLFRVIEEKTVYESYYACLLPLLRRGDEEAQSLFNKIALESFGKYSSGAYRWFDHYAAGLVKNETNPTELEMVVRVMDNFRMFRRSQEKGNSLGIGYAGQELMLDKARRAQEKGENPVFEGGDFDFLTGETCLKIKEVPPEERQKEAETEYLAAMELMNINPFDGLGRLLTVERLGNKEARERLDEIRKLNGYKNPKKAKKDDIGCLLKCLEPSASDLFNSAMGMWSENPSLAAGNLLKAAKLGSREAKKKLGDIRKSKSYKSPNKQDIGHWLSYFDNEENKKPDTIALQKTSLIHKEKEVLEPEPVEKLPDAAGIPRPHSPNNGKVESKDTTYTKSALKKLDYEAVKEIYKTYLVRGEVSPSKPTKIQMIDHIMAQQKQPAGAKNKSLKKKDTPLTPEIQPNLKNDLERSLQLPANMPALNDRKPEETTAPVIQAGKGGKLISGLPMIDDRLPTESQEEGKASVKAGTAPLISLQPERPRIKVRKTLPQKPLLRRHSAIELQKKNTEEKQRIQRTQSSVNLKERFPETNKLEKEERKEKPVKSLSPTRSLKDYLRKKDSGKKLERRTSQSSLISAGHEEESDCSSSERSDADTPQEALFKQEGKKDTDLSRLRKRLENRDISKPSAIKLNRSLVTRSLRELGPQGKKIITWNLETAGNKKEDKITATHINNPGISLCIHLHSRCGKWYEDENIKAHFLNFVRQCDQSVDELMKAIERK